MSPNIDRTALQPFAFRASDTTLTMLRQRVAATRWPEKETVGDQSQGVPLETIQQVAQYWEQHYDWRPVESRLAALPQFVTEIDGLDIHFVHVRSEHEDALPIIVTHGWPGSVIEQLKIVEPLVDPTAHGGDAADAFHVVIPSLPGYGFSGKPARPGWTPDRVAMAWTELARRLGYTSFVAQGGDWGAIITDLMGVQAPPELIGIHTNMPGAVPPEIDRAIQSGTPPPADLSGAEKRAVEQLDFVYRHIAYAQMMATRPQTLTGLVDSPVGLAAFLLDHDAKSLDLIARAFAGQPGGLTRDDVLDNVTLYWLTDTAISSARLYAENTHSIFATKGVDIPAAVSVFPDELYTCPRSWAERAYPKLIHYNTLDRGGHFAAWEQPDLFVAELRASFRSLR
ncbi:pimeloyl-ACP methyl ester carboxylesterase [Nocardia transvalensis]|uniref:Pimeloyl-ACP methyl ester carboxylesterase n=1 Tax=Nocardia transvalensis TaxID=37333 RepID=A0A7W9PGS4_9NOCA|nr:epoxide hydrolase family protein [Nocardia transvalensis]MBB5915338.1 pimeloyl-ACP methyl ester carboxylesterase [Nocardia transvalensis]